MRQDILAALRGHSPRRVPWTIHHELLPRGSLERRLRERGLAIVDKGVRPYRQGSGRVSIEERQGWEGDHRLILRTWHTPLGDLASRLRDGPDGSLWTERFPLGSAADFRLLEYIAEDTEYRPNDQAVTAAQQALGEDGLVLCRLMRSPLQRLLTEWLGTLGLSYALADAPRELDRLLARLGASDQAALHIAAGSPAEAVWSAENLTGEVVGPELFARYLAPYYERAAGILHAGGKLYGAHFDGRLARLKKAIAATRLDFIEGFTPPPLGDLGLEEAREAWPGKALWLNIPGSLFLADGPEVVRQVRELLRWGEAAGSFLLTLTEEFPEPAHGLELVAEAVEAEAGSRPPAGEKLDNAGGPEASSVLDYRPGKGGTGGDS
jgi:hypothetical protein